MALFSNKTEEEKVNTEVAASDDSATLVTPGITITPVAKNRHAVIIPRLSEKSTAMEKLNKYVFRIEGKINKVELRKTLEKVYGVKVAGINVITVKSRARRYGKTSGRVSGFKKAVVTLKPDSKKIEVAEAV